MIGRLKFDKDTIKQKWNGVAQHVAAIVLDSTDTIVLSTFSTLINVSIYSVYNIVISGIKQIVTSAFGGVGAFLLGELWAKGEKKELNSYFEKIEMIFAPCKYGSVAYHVVSCYSICFALYKRCK